MIDHPYRRGDLIVAIDEGVVLWKGIDSAPAFTSDGGTIMLVLDYIESDIKDVITYAVLMEGAVCYLDIGEWQYTRKL